jgi:CDGSH-type Zn-finger protein
MTPKQCLCGRSEFYPYCDGSHSIKQEQSLNIDQSEIKNKENDII